MRLINYLDEAEFERDLGLLSKAIKEKCGPFLDTIKPIIGTGKCFIRRVHSYVPFFVIKTPRTDRKPADTSPEFHNAFDQAFKEKFGWKARSEGVFTYPVKDIKNCFQGQYIFYPIGNFKFIYSPVIDDLFVVLDDYKMPEEEVVRLMPTYVNKNLLKVFQGKFDGRNIYPETMFKCKQYYLVNKNYADSLMNNGVL